MKIVKHELKQVLRFLPPSSSLHYYSLFVGHVSLNRILKYFHHDFFAHGTYSTALEVRSHAAFSLFGHKNNFQSHESSTFDFPFQTVSIQDSDEQDVT